MIDLFINEEAEKSVLGSIIMNNDNIAKVLDILEPKHFAVEFHSKLYENIIEVMADIKADSITLSEFFKINQMDGYQAQLLSSICPFSSERDYAIIIRGLWQKRELENLLKESLDSLNENSFDKVKASFENELLGLAIQEPKKKTQHISEMIDEFTFDQENGIKDKFVSTGYSDLDSMLNGGLYSKQLAILGARPSIGKTTLGQNIILNATKSGNKCLFISLEVDKRNVTLKFLSNVASIPAWKISRNMISDSDRASLELAKERLKDMMIYTNDSSNMRARDIENVIKNQLELNPVDLVVVDYVQYIRNDNVKGMNEAWSIKENTTALKSMAKQYDVAMLALAQINRKAVEGANQEPTINDFKGSGGIEEDADVAMIIHRDRLQEDEKQKGYFSNSTKIIVAKNRHGQTGEVMLNFDGEFGRFTEMEEF